MRLSIAEEQILSDIYQEIINENMGVADVAGTENGTYGTTTRNADGTIDYADKDLRTPYVTGKVQTRKGAIGKKSKNKIKKRLPEKNVILPIAP